MATKRRIAKRSTTGKKQKAVKARKYPYQTQLLVLATLSLFFVFLPGMNVYSSIIPQHYPSPITSLPLQMPTPHPYPLSLPNFIPPQTRAQAIIIEDYETGAVLYEKNSTMLLPPASLMKLLTAVVAMEHCHKDQEVRATIPIPLQSDESRMGLVVGEKIRVENLLYGLLLPSGNDAAQTLAVQCKSNDESFVDTMNTRAKQLGMIQTHITNPIGQDEVGNVTTAADLAKLTRYFLKNQLFADIVQVPYKQVTDTTGTFVHPLMNTNVLLRNGRNVVGVKTGTTDAAGQNFIALVKTSLGGQKILIVLLASPDRFAEARYLETWALGNFVWKLPAPIPDFSHLGLQ